jgi:Lar family restriction alleviation protein
MSDTELKPCPFCGGEDLAVIKDPRDQWLPWYLVLCNADDCHTLGPARRNKPDAITAWNTRQPDPQVTALVEALRAIESTPNYRCCAADMRKLARTALNAWEQSNG